VVVWIYSVFPLDSVVVKVVNIKYRASVCLFVFVCLHACTCAYSHIFCYIMTVFFKDLNGVSA
jgi:hypothetical protein